MSAESVSTCVNCGFEAPRGGETWEPVVHPSIGRLTQCLECGSTRVHSR